ncbi:hypothetical protein EXN66_Car007085 [Channa argus]|uniref:Uncharacterized protein n=1 Tax=Channa argus TaxID=215402 RepID=A0A6G1PM78_CHAAH|nr:hypothetical protein EXN66_Car007085 [Channa argus]
MKLWERAMEARLRAEVNICEQQYGFMPSNRWFSLGGTRMDRIRNEDGQDQE